MILENGTIVAVIDGEAMRLFRNRGHEPHVDLIGLPDPDLGVGNTGSGSRHRSSSANPDTRRIKEDDFAAAAAGYLNKEALAGRIERLLIVADPRTLGELRKHFHDTLAAKLTGEIAKDLTAHSAEAIQAAIADA
ncbi:host attachment protein [Mesorhizobium sp. CCNWLW179-1]|uniref:baeRF12 domain-containing protein n=1 Tax=unclassified Mesorhizobium TaxID=325217 RepID=UPI0008E6D3B2|nr:host attachment protein [Mesorhizobium sp. YR577]SFU21468.1 Protein required for attachment to host cells [Mesorhizobium sp. YR577]